MIYEALIIGFKEAFKIGIVWLVLFSYLYLNNKNSLIKYFYIGITLVLAISSGYIFFAEIFVKENLNNIIETSFAFIFIISVATLIYAHKAEINNNIIKNYLENKRFLSIFIFITTIFFFLPDSIGTAIFLKELSIMKEDLLMTYLSALTGILPTLGIFFVIIFYFKPYWIGGLFGLPQFLLFLSMVKLLGSGIKGIAELSLIPSVQRGLMKFFHDFIHQVFVLLMVPDHPLFKTTAWNFIGLFFGPNFASISSLFVLLLFPFIFLYYSLFSPLPEPECRIPAKKRKIKYSILIERRKKAIPVIFFIFLILFSWLYKSGESASQIYVPKPKPVVEDKGLITIPITDPTMDLMDGRIHKFSILYNEEKIVFLIIKKRDGSIAVCLDACEICPPEDGYGQSAEDLICIYCNTPIPINTVGEHGGCNPIPLSFSIDENFIKIEIKEILKKWDYVKSGSGKEVIK